MLPISLHIAISSLPKTFLFNTHVYIVNLDIETNIQVIGKKIVIEK